MERRGLGFKHRHGRTFPARIFQPLAQGFSIALSAAGAARESGIRDMGIRDMGMWDVGMRDPRMRDAGMRDPGM